jgi:thiamine-monophosphate kinase
MTLPTEFALIAQHFRPLAAPAALGLEDDAAVLAPPPGRDLVIAADAMVAGVHFLPDDPPALLGRKLLRVNLSDLAAMGAVPLGYLMTLAVPTGTGEAFFADFAAGLALDQAEFAIALLGGDTTATPGVLTLSLTVLGHVAPGTALRRRGARPGDSLWVSGTIGDGALGLRAARGALPDPEGFLAGRYRLPRPRLGLQLCGIASAAMDVSDGLVQDVGHLCRAGGLAAEIERALVPRSPQALAAAPEDWLACLTGGDDYELVFAVPPGREAALAAEAARSDIPVTRIGRFRAGVPAVRVLDAAGETLVIQRGGWSHF